GEGQWGSGELGLIELHSAEGSLEDRSAKPFDQVGKWHWLPLYNNPQGSRGFHNFLGNRRGQASTIASVLDNHCERNPLRRVSIIGSKAGEPGVRLAFVKLRRTGLAGDAHRRARHGAARGPEIGRAHV